jgi:hypothetical protein
MFVSYHPGMPPGIYYPTTQPSEYAPHHAIQIQPHATPGRRPPHRDHSFYFYTATTVLLLFFVVALHYTSAPHAMYTPAADQHMHTPAADQHMHTPAPHGMHPYAPPHTRRRHTRAGRPDSARRRTSKLAVHKDKPDTVRQQKDAPVLADTQPGHAEAAADASNARWSGTGPTDTMVARANQTVFVTAERTGRLGDKRKLAMEWLCLCCVTSGAAPHTLADDSCARCSKTATVRFLGSELVYRIHAPRRRDEVYTCVFMWVASQ